MIERNLGRRHTFILFTLFFIIAFPASGHALCEATLHWDNSNTIAQGYYVFGREEGQDYDYDEPWWQGDNSFSSCSIEDLEEDQQYYFVIRAYADDDVSADSNEVSFSSDDNTSSSLTGDGTSDSSGSSFHGSSSGCFLNSIFGSN